MSSYRTRWRENASPSPRRSTSPRSSSRAALADVFPASAGVGLGVVRAYAALRQIWLAIALIPLLRAVERLYARVVALRREMATALETGANIVDERHSSTYGHSLRVAG